MISSHTRALDSVPELTELLAQPAAAGFLTATGGLVGFEPLRRLTVSGPRRFQVADRWWRRLMRCVSVTPSSDDGPTGPVAFGSFAFSDGETRSVLTVPRRVLRVEGERAWLTTLYCSDVKPSSGRPPARRSDVRWRPEDATASYAGDEAEWKDGVARALAAIRDDDVLDKVVLARHVRLATTAAIDVAGLVRDLGSAYPDATLFAHEGLVGASPELLVRLHDGVVESAALAGTRIPGEREAPSAAEHALLTSSKHLAEFAHVEDWVRETLGRVCFGVVTTPKQVRRFGRLTHIESMTRGHLATSGMSSLELAAALHPTPAVCGTPAGAARDLIGRIESVDRGRYAGPVGWMDWRGDGEWMVALRCCEVGDGHVDAFAGCGIVEGSTPEAEYAEAVAKLDAVLRFLPISPPPALLPERV